MLSARAYSFKQKSRLAISLSWIGGYTNVVVFLATGAFIAHASGSATQFGRFIGEGNFERAGFFGFLIVSFTFGAALSACMTECARRRGWRSKYILPIGLEALLLALLSLHLKFHGGVPTGLNLYE